MWMVALACMRLGQQYCMLICPFHCAQNAEKSENCRRWFEASAYACTVHSIWIMNMIWVSVLVRMWVLLVGMASYASIWCQLTSYWTRSATLRSSTASVPCAIAIRYINITEMAPTSTSTSAKQWRNRGEGESTFWLESRNKNICSNNEKRRLVEPPEKRIPFTTIVSK